uniref:Uncharacterized protein n=1 Tax=Acrobeloides nanus TaxID=290746 RepID=A0A914DUT8_9BILA
MIHILIGAQDDEFEIQIRQSSLACLKFCIRRSLIRRSIVFINIFVHGQKRWSSFEDLWNTSQKKCKI